MLYFNYPSRIFAIIIGLAFMASCSVSNNLYVADPNPLGKGNSTGYLGIGSGVKAKIDSINSSSGKIFFSNDISTAPILALGAQRGISNKTDVRFALHLPYGFGGVGMRVGLQHSFMDSSSKMNFAIGIDAGGVLAKDSIKLFGSQKAVNTETNGGLNADIFIPFSIKLQKDVLLIFTPRYSFNRIYVRKYQTGKNTSNFNLGYPAFSIGVRKRKFYFETTALVYDSKVFPHFGFAILFED